MQQYILCPGGVRGGSIAACLDGTISLFRYSWSAALSAQPLQCLELVSPWELAPIWLIGDIIDTCNDTTYGC